MDSKTLWSLFFGIMNHLLAWVLPVIYVATEYSFFVSTTAGNITFLGIIMILVAFRFFMHRLRTMAESGFGMEKEMAREVRFLLPILLLLGFLAIVQTNIANLYHVFMIVLLLNIPASVFRVVSYRLSRRYDNDTAAYRLLQEQKKNNNK